MKVKCKEQHLQEVGKHYRVVRVQVSVNCWGEYDRFNDVVRTFSIKENAERYCNKLKLTDDAHYYVEEV